MDFLGDKTATKNLMIIIKTRMGRNEETRKGEILETVTWKEMKKEKRGMINLEN